MEQKPVDHECHHIAGPTSHYNFIVGFEVRLDLALEIHEDNETDNKVSAEIKADSCEAIESVKSCSDTNKDG